MKKFISCLIAFGFIGSFFCRAVEKNTLTSVEAEAFLKENISNPKVKIIDVRTPEEYSQGHLVSAININWHDSEFEKLVNNLDKDITYIIYCKRGGRSASALEKMLSMGFKDVKHIGGGFDEWKELGFKYE
jgi:phage shock protein E